MSLPPDEPTPDVPVEKHAKSRKKSVIEWVIVLIAAVLVSFTIRTFVFQTFLIPSASMNPTFYNGNRILVDKLSVDFGTINVGDIVVFKAPPDVAKICNDPVTDLVKRVIGLPGDVLNTKGNTIYRNGKKLDQKWSVFPTMGPEAIKDITVPAGQYFMMGDNHANSCDSRMWGTVPRSDIIGKVFLKIWPLSQWHWY
ncbi:MAG TPA: signal peptidase I [Acidimicrobiales bacterium]|jgi:signal peptidase I|nr:signal peptidase I [Acidimicrobiales bacterium]